MMVCAVCGKGFEAKNYWQKYCSKSCRQAMWALNKLENEKPIKTFSFVLDEDISKQLEGYVLDKSSIFKVEVSFYCKPVDRLSKKTKENIKKGEKVYCDSIPDLDNSIKPVLDKLTGVIWHNDRSVVELKLKKLFSNEVKTLINIKVY